MFYNIIIVLSLSGLWQHIGYTITDLIPNIAFTAIKIAFNNLFLVFSSYFQLQIALADRAAKNIH